MILTDIEGTTSSIHFVKDVLFPYAYKHMPTFVEAHQNSPELGEILAQVRAEVSSPQLGPAQCVEILRAWIKEDKKATPLKALQGLIWKDGFEKGEFTGHLYPDAYEVLKRWHEENIPIYIYSSGSIAAQKLYFTYSDFGDLSSWFSGHFDTTIGSKLEGASYLNISACLGVPPQSITFLSDNLQELDGAKSAGMPTVWLNREGLPLTPPPHHPMAKDFYDVQKSKP